MMRMRFVLPIAIAALATTVLSVNIVLAQESDKVDSSTNKFAIKVAEILDLDATEVDDAMKQARKELRDEAIQEKLNALIGKGDLTQDEADEYLAWIQAKPDGVRAIGSHFFGTKGHKKDWQKPLVHHKD